MSHDPPRPAGRLLLTPADGEAPARVRRLRRLGPGRRPEPALDAFADRLAARTEAPYAVVDLPDGTGQFRAGLHTPGGAGRTASARDARHAKPAPGTPASGRRLPREYGFCPHVRARRKALVLEDVRDYPRFAGNPVADECGVRSHPGAPPIDGTGIVPGTVCVADVEPRPWGRAGLETVKATAADLAARLEQPADGFPLRRHPRPYAGGACAGGPCAGGA
ncbi:GAF domain-containing protein [Streptomyces glaucus]|uniref:GAF domain-containing protein n=1 Tax=Streptomyces glaucus TaxID=284029 RepID=A0ABP5XPY6_9ACTN